MQVEEIDVVDAQPLQAGLAGLSDIAGVAVHPRPGDAELGGQEDLVAPPRQEPPDQGLVVAHAVDVGGVPEGDPELQGAAEGGQGFRLVRRLAVDGAHGHAPQAQGGDLRTVRAKLPGLHVSLLGSPGRRPGPGILGFRGGGSRPGQ